MSFDVIYSLFWKRIIYFLLNGKYGYISIFISKCVYMTSFVCVCVSLWMSGRYNYARLWKGGFNVVAAGDLRCSNIPVTTGKIMQITENCYPAHPHSKKSRVFPFVASLLLFVHRVFDLIIGNLAFCVIILGDKGELPAGLKYIEYTCTVLATGEEEMWKLFIFLLRVRKTLPPYAELLKLYTPTANVEYAARSEFQYSNEQNDDWVVIYNAHTEYDSGNVRRKNILLPPLATAEYYLAFSNSLNITELTV